MVLHCVDLLDPHPEDLLYPPPEMDLLDPTPESCADLVDLPPEVDIVLYCVDLLHPPMNIEWLTRPTPLKGDLLYHILAAEMDIAVFTEVLEPPLFYIVWTYETCPLKWI